MYDYKKIRSILTSFDYQASSLPIASLFIKKYYIRDGETRLFFMGLEGKLNYKSRRWGNTPEICLSYSAAANCLVNI